MRSVSVRSSIGLVTFLVVAVVLLLGGVRHCRPAPAPLPVSDAELYEQLLGKTPDEVRAALGEPDSFTEFKNDPVWRYETHVRSNAVMLQWTDGKVSHVYRWDRYKGESEICPINPK